jgi:hypothetical protein
VLTSHSMEVRGLGVDVAIAVSRYSALACTAQIWVQMEMCLQEVRAFGLHHFLSPLLWSSGV